MIPVPSGVHVWLATGHTDMRKGFGSLALLVQETLKRDPYGGDLFIVSSLDLNPRLQTGRGFSRFFVHRLTP
jgi:transposase